MKTMMKIICAIFIGGLMLTFMFKLYNACHAVDWQQNIVLNYIYTNATDKIKYINDANKIIQDCGYTVYEIHDNCNMSFGVHCVEIKGYK